MVVLIILSRWLHIIAAVLAFGAGSASAAIANFKASLTGTYTTSGSVTESGCWEPGPPPDGDQIPLPPQTGHVTATDSFSSVRPQVQGSRTARTRSPVR